MTVVDVGRMQDLRALAMRLTGADGTVVAIKPHTESRRFLEMTIKANAGTRTQVHVSDCAASDHEGKASCSSIRRIKPIIDCTNPKQPPTRNAPVQLRTIDAILVDLGIHTIDILKIDAQGSEFSAITGAANASGTRQE